MNTKDVDWDSLHQILQGLYDEMMPLCENLITPARAMGVIGATFYVAYRVWKHLAKNESIDVFPLLRPYVLAICLTVFPSIVNLINDILSPIEKATADMVAKQNINIAELSKKRDELERQAILKNPDRAYLESRELFEQKTKDLKIYNLEEAPQLVSMYMERAMYNLQKDIRHWFREILEVLFQAAALVIDTIRTFFLIVLAILGPIAFGMSIYDGFQSTLTNWISRYINVWLWLPIANIFGAIIAKLNVLILEKGIADMEKTGIPVDATDVTYLIFLIIGIIGYGCVPTVANWIVHAGHGGNSYTQKVTQAFTGVMRVGAR